MLFYVLEPFAKINAKQTKASQQKSVIIVTLNHGFWCLVWALVWALVLVYYQIQCPFSCVYFSTRYAFSVCKHFSVFFLLCILFSVPGKHWQVGGFAVTWAEVLTCRSCTKFMKFVTLPWECAPLRSLLPGHRRWLGSAVPSLSQDRLPSPVPTHVLVSPSPDLGVPRHLKPHLPTSRTLGLPPWNLPCQGSRHVLGSTPTCHQLPPDVGPVWPWVVTRTCHLWSPSVPAFSNGTHGALIPLVGPDTPSLTEPHRPCANRRPQPDFGSFWPQCGAQCSRDHRSPFTACPPNLSK